LRNVLTLCRKLKLSKSCVYSKKLESIRSPLTVAVPHAANLGLANYVVRVKPVESREYACLNRIKSVPFWKAIVMVTDLSISVNFMLPKKLTFWLFELLKRIESEGLSAFHSVHRVGEHVYLFPDPRLYNPRTKKWNYSFQNAINLISNLDEVIPKEPRVSASGAKHYSVRTLLVLQKLEEDGRISGSKIAQSLGLPPILVRREL
jgi:hypothetical protein